ncbi:MAG TPA: HAMP domain-containing sensor histidine kinase [Caldimonas sp.]|nr:HAMP domain-containing sensor histidine kinase [Caldimonas sp.]
MGTKLANFVPTLNAWVDWFIPQHLKQSRDQLQAVRMFLFSHLFGPFLGHTISLSMLYVGGQADLNWWIFFGAVTAFWPFPILLRLTGRYVPLALVSIENLMFCIFWGCYQYGGISSPIMPWLVTVPLLAFFYLPERSTRIIVALLIVTNLALFYGVYAAVGFPETVAPHGLVLLGLVSTLCASVYVSMMALYFGSIVFSQGELEQEVQRHQETERKLLDATDQAQRALLAKSEFLAKMSHELKNPLNAIIGYSEILIEDVGGTQSQKWKDLTSIRGAGFRLLALIDVLLELSKLEAGKVELRVEEIEFAVFFDNLVSRFRPSIAASGNELIVRPPPKGKIACDPEKLQRVFEGLLSNAAKFTSNGRITFSASLRDDSWIVSIEDTGVGIAEARMGSLFETFGSSEDETASKYVDEVRLGLPLAHRYCRLMGGTLSVQSKVGVGSTVTVSLPKPPPAAGERANGRVEFQPQPA